MLLIYLCTNLYTLFFFYLVFKENYPARSTFQVGKLPMVWNNIFYICTYFKNLNY